MHGLLPARELRTTGRLCAGGLGPAGELRAAGRLRPGVLWSAGERRARRLRGRGLGGTEHSRAGRTGRPEGGSKRGTVRSSVDIPMTRSRPYALPRAEAR
ncbi:hypothetical protein ACWEPC_17275, partial [Nonomuraea sp. NPDC004297]